MAAVLSRPPKQLISATTAPFLPPVREQPITLDFALACTSFLIASAMAFAAAKKLSKPFLWEAFGTQPSH